MDIPPNSHETLDFAVTLKSTSHSWWHSTQVDGKLDGKSEGVSVQRSGTFSEISESVDSGTGPSNLPLKDGTIVEDTPLEE